MSNGLIDLHHHGRPAAFFSAVAATGRTTMGGRPFPPAWTTDTALRMMDQRGIRTAILSAPDADLLYKDSNIALRLSRILNEMFAEVADSRPARFGGFASLPMPHIDLAIAEAAYALDLLKLDGVMLSSSYSGCYLGHPKFEPLMIELDRRQAVVFVHPVTPPGTDVLSLDFPAALLEYVFDTTRCIVSLLRHDYPERFPSIKFVFSHAGGAAPYLDTRLGLLEHFFDSGEFRRPAGRSLRHFYYDVALSCSGPILEFLKRVVGLDRVVFGSDYPQCPEPLIGDSIATLSNSQLLSAEERRAVGAGNACRLLPRLSRL
jgi:predicted TIM-barrel fold metal-dependent hydrolase